MIMVTPMRGSCVVPCAPLLMAMMTALIRRSTRFTKHARFLLCYLLPKLGARAVWAVLMLHDHSTIVPLLTITGECHSCARTYPSEEIRAQTHNRHNTDVSTRNCKTLNMYNTVQHNLRRHTRKQPCCLCVQCCYTDDAPKAFKRTTKQH